ncbi:trimethylamine:corrinoid methyltransferase [Desulfosporosinus orientis DSM 765]|uniref:Trimethylamine:corrinoid methyltransferase n=1 Tax=Desulfosporosinus orientis (strain ATCC 19365 / DSM 765 / NCIMB 8382 / VKM B-1628 / Singapore I) TaxID=768706 RepID=G7W6W2_DESOD|nr:trimethylamine methyltransferase family protein [Desulfosporosinus orientis]AET69819.1 trimethylamine:corrinoid methyltransferase [Desulfosporosinus orientis DSM 765]
MSLQIKESKFTANKTLQFKVLEVEEIEKILKNSIKILELTGVTIYADEARSLLSHAGCSVDGTRVRIPARLIEKALQTVPSKIVLSDRTGTNKLFLEGNNSYFGPGPTCPYFNDPETGERRNTITQDVVNTALVADALPNIDFVMSLSMISDCTSTLADVYEVRAMLQNTIKPIVGWTFDVEGLKEIVDMCCAVAGSLEELQKNPFLAIYCEPTSPLTHSKEALEKLLFLAEKNLPAIYTPGMVLGGTAPITIAGALSEGVADTLVGLLLSQLKREGAPYIAAAPGGPLDMKTMQHSYGAPEWTLVHAASTDIFHYLNVPIWSAAGASDSKIVDGQAAIEATLQIFTAAASGAHLIHDVGFTDLGLTGSLEQLVMGDEIIGMVRRLIKGVEVDEEHLAFDTINEIGPGGSFLGNEHTFLHFRKEMWSPTLLDRQGYSGWEAEGKKSMYDRISEKVKRILREHKPEPLSEKVSKELDEIIAAAEQRVRVKNA